MRKRITEQEFKSALREFLALGPDEEVKQEVERLEMELASPGDWEAAKYTVEPKPE
jgi:hypothetical protein